MPVILIFSVVSFVIRQSGPAVEAVGRWWHEGNPTMASVSNARKRLAEFGVRHAAGRFQGGQASRDPRPRGQDRPSRRLSMAMVGLFATAMVGPMFLPDPTTEKNGSTRKLAEVGAGGSSDAPSPSLDLLSVPLYAEDLLSVLEGRESEGRKVSEVPGVEVAASVLSLLTGQGMQWPPAGSKFEWENMRAAEESPEVYLQYVAHLVQHDADGGVEGTTRAFENFFGLPLPSLTETAEMARRKAAFALEAPAEAPLNSMPLYVIALTGGSCALACNAIASLQDVGLGDRVVVLAYDAEAYECAEEWGTMVEDLSQLCIGCVSETNVLRPSEFTSINQAKVPAMLYLLRKYRRPLMWLDTDVVVFTDPEPFFLWVPEGDPPRQGHDMLWQSDNKDWDNLCATGRGENGLDFRKDGGVQLCGGQIFVNRTAGAVRMMTAMHNRLLHNFAAGDFAKANTQSSANALVRSGQQMGAVIGVLDPGMFMNGKNWDYRYEKVTPGCSAGIDTSATADELEARACAVDGSRPHPVIAHMNAINVAGGNAGKAARLAMYDIWVAPRMCGLGSRGALPLSFFSKEEHFICRESEFWRREHSAMRANVAGDAYPGKFDPIVALAFDGHDCPLVCNAARHLRKIPGLWARAVGVAWDRDALRCASNVGLLAVDGRQALAQLENGDGFYGINRAKIPMTLELMRQFDRPVMWVDTDTVFLQDPFDDLIGPHAAMFAHAGRDLWWQADAMTCDADVDPAEARLCGGMLLVNNTDNARATLEEVRLRINARIEQGADHADMQSVVNEMLVAKEPLDASIGVLDPALFLSGHRMHIAHALEAGLPVGTAPLGSTTFHAPSQADLAPGGSLACLAVQGAFARAVLVHDNGFPFLDAHARFDHLASLGLMHPECIDFHT